MVYRLHHIRRTWGQTSGLCPPRPRPQGQYLQGKADVNHDLKNMQMMQTFQVNHLHLWLQHLMRCELVLFKGYHGLPWGHVLLWNWNWIGLLKGCCCLPRGHLLLWNQRISPLAQQVGLQEHNTKPNKTQQNKTNQKNTHNTSHQLGVRKQNTNTKTHIAYKKNQQLGFPETLYQRHSRLKHLNAWIFVWATYTSSSTSKSPKASAYLT